MLFISMLEILIDRNEHNDSGGYKGKYDIEIDNDRAESIKLLGDV